MSTTEIASTDLESLLAPVSHENPCGEWLRYEGTYDQVREARREDDPALPQGVWQAELKRADWDAVQTLCVTALATRSKDLQLAVWLLEAWIQLDGFSGAAKGLELICRLCEAYWDSLYPPLEADLTPRLAAIRWINDKLSRRLRLLPLTDPSMPGVPAYSLANWDVAMRNPTRDTGNGNPSTDGITLTKFEQSVSVTSYEWFCALKDSVDATLKHIRALDSLIDQRAGKESPGLVKLRSEAEAVGELVETMLTAARAKLPAPPAATAPESNRELDFSAASSALVRAEPQLPLKTEEVLEQSSFGPIRSRADAYRQLEEIAEFLYRNDPHSPTPYLIRRAVAWGQMHFDELLPELVKSDGDMSEIMKLLRLDHPEGN
jgi:type VI secretion system protein ImpA